MNTIGLPAGLPVGFRFHPTDKELISDYLKPKLLGTDPDVDRVIAEVDFCNFEPWELPPKSKIKSKDQIWLFFCRRDYKYPSSKRSKRTTRRGFWKVTGKERVIKDQETKACIGKKRTLVFHLGSAASGRGERTDWVVQEYYIEPDHTFPSQIPFALCRLKRKGNDMANTPDGRGGEPRGDKISGVENSGTPTANLLVHGREEVNLTDDEISLAPSVGFSRGHNNIQALGGDGNLEEHGEEFLNQLVADPDAESYEYVEYNPTVELQCASLLDSSFARFEGSQVLQGGSIEETVISPRDHFSEEDGSISILTRGRHQRRIQPPERVSSTVRPQNKVGEEAETRNPISPTEICFIALLGITILSTIVLTAFIGLLVSGIHERVLEFSRKRRSFVLFCSVLSCSIAFLLLGV